MFKNLLGKNHRGIQKKYINKLEHLKKTLINYTKEVIRGQGNGELVMLKIHESNSFH